MFSNFPTVKIGIISETTQKLLKNLLKTLDKTKFVENLVGVSLLLGTLVESLFLVGCKFNFYNATLQGMILFSSCRMARTMLAAQAPGA